MKFRILQNSKVQVSFILFICSVQFGCAAGGDVNIKGEGEGARQIISDIKGGPGGTVTLPGLNVSPNLNLSFGDEALKAAKTTAEAYINTLSLPANTIKALKEDDAKKEKFIVDKAVEAAEKEAKDPVTEAARNELAEEIKNSIRARNMEN